MNCSIEFAGEGVLAGAEQETLITPTALDYLLLFPKCRDDGWFQSNI